MKTSDVGKGGNFTWMSVKLAWRSIWRNRRRTIITLSSIGLGLTMSVFFVAWGDGMYDKLIDEAVRMQAGHLTLEHPEYRDAPAIDLVIQANGLRDRIANIPGVERVKSLVVGQGMARTGHGSIPVGLMGVVPEEERISSPLARKIVQGEYLDSNDGRSAIIGSKLAERLQLQLGKKLVIASNNAKGELVEELVRVRGVFETGSDELDSFFVQIPIDRARKLYGLGPDQVTFLGVVLKNADERDEVTERIEAELRQDADARVAVRTWEEVMPDLSAFVQVDKGSNYVFQVILLLIIMFTIFNSILMSVTERKHEFAVLLAIGTSPARIQWQIFLESAFIGLLGCAIGLGLGGGLSYYFSLEGIDITSMMKDGMSISGFAVDPVIKTALRTRLLAVWGGGVFLGTLVMSLYPMSRIKRIPIANVLR